MAHRKVTVFWTAEEQSSWITSELLDGRLRQGWGIPGSQLTANGVPVPFSRWFPGFAVNARKYWNWDPDTDAAKARYNILVRMTMLNTGDLVVVPRIPMAGEFTIACVRDGYIFDDRHFTTPMPGAPNMHDFAHVVRVDPKRLVTCGYSSSPEAKLIVSKFQYYRSAVNNVRDPLYVEAVESLFR